MECNNCYKDCMRVNSAIKERNDAITLVCQIQNYIERRYERQQKVFSSGKKDMYDLGMLHIVAMIKHDVTEIVEGYYGEYD